MVDITLVDQLVSIGSGIATIIVIYFLWKAVKQMDESVKVGRVQLQYRFRPWIGPSSGIEVMGTTPEGKQQFVIKLKNYGEIPASNVVAKFTMKNEEPARDILKNSELIDSFNLGPLLPNMEKRYWFFIDADLLRRTKENTEVFVALYFAYEFAAGKSGYGMISHFDPNANAFVHIDMWAD